jgi:hypothetical protein
MVKEGPYLLFMDMLQILIGLEQFHLVLLCHL